jgi:hypothetical protein
MIGRKNLRLILFSFVMILMSSCAEKQPDFSNPENIAMHALKAIKAKNTDVLLNLSCESIKDECSSYSSKRIKEEWGVFRGWRWDSVKNWNGKIYGTTFRHYTGTEIDSYAPRADSYEANVQYGYVEHIEVLVVNLVWENEEWRFADIHSPDRSKWEKGKTTFDLTQDPY